jgi:O-antigen/teichoic acid export membrane protein
MVMVVSKIFFKEKQYDAQFIGDLGENDEITPVGALLKKLILIALPITISASVMSLTNLIDAAIVQRRLQTTGLSQVAAGNHGFPGLVPVTSGSFSGCL